MDFLAQLDTNIFLWLNGHHNTFTDSIMWVISDRHVWIPLYAIMAYAVVRRYSWRAGLVIILFIGMAVGASDYVCASILRPAIERMRPSNPDNPISTLVHTVNGYHSGRYGFPSCHAANTFALALFFAMVMRKRWVSISIILWSFIVCYSRIHLGVHYPGDIICGMFMGTLFTIVFYIAAQYALQWMNINKEASNNLKPLPFIPFPSARGEQ